jgi:hypothetical protein
LIKTLSKLASAQQTFKGLDGAAHEAYQRTHSDGDVADISVAGRAQRSAARLAAVAEALHACELIELVEQPRLVMAETNEDRQGGEDVQVVKRREVILNVSASESVTSSNVTIAGRPLSIVAFFDPSYDGGAGLEHGSLMSTMESTSLRRGRPPNGRLIIALGDIMTENLVQTLQILDEGPLKIKLSSGLVTGEVASVQPTLYNTAGQLLTFLEPLLRQYNTSAIHFVGHSLAGSVASLAATILDGSIPMPRTNTSKVRKSKRSKIRVEKNTTTSKTDAVPIDTNNKTRVEADGEEHRMEPLNGLGRARCSALTLGSPPCLSSNVLAAFCTSFVYGDDVVCRTTQDSLNKLVERMKRILNGGFLGRNFGWMSDTVSMTVSSLQSHAHGSEGEEVKLSIPGRAYLVRPRRLGGICSIHEVGNLKKGGREALRESLLWQLNDVLLSNSMWKHHNLESYIQGLDRVQLRGISDSNEGLME